MATGGRSHPSLDGDVHADGVGVARRLSWQGAEKGPDARRRPKAAREADSLYVERAAEGANDADGPCSAACERRPDEREHRQRHHDGGGPAEGVEPWAVDPRAHDLAIVAHEHDEQEQGW